jgi:hypothetical protein
MSETLRCKCGAITVKNGKASIWKICGCGIIVSEIAPEPGEVLEVRLYPVKEKK